MSFCSGKISLLINDNLLVSLFLQAPKPIFANKNVKCLVWSKIPKAQFYFVRMDFSPSFKCNHKGT